MEVNRKEEKRPLEDAALAAFDKMKDNKQSTEYSVQKLWESHCKHEKLDVRKMPPFQIQKIKRAFYGGVSQLLALQAGPLSKLNDVAAGDILREFIVENNKFWEKEKAKK